MWSPAARPVPLDLNTPLAQVSFHDDGSRGLAAEGSSSGKEEEAKSIDEGSNFHGLPYLPGEGAREGGHWER